MQILVTGGAGFIGSHTCVELLASGYKVIVLDNFSNSRRSVLDRVQKITGKPADLFQADISDKNALRRIFSNNDIKAVIHFAGYKSVNESVADPLGYYQNNVCGSLVLFEVMAEFGVHDIVFSSSAAVYGDPASVPIREDFPLSATNPYGRSKLMLEDILRDLYVSDKKWNTILLRYFNPVGAHDSGMLGESPNETPNNLAPYVAQVAAGERPFLSVFGKDYPTPDGTGVRDYIHVVDLAKGHLNALEKLSTGTGILTYNLGTGRGYSVLEMVAAFERASGKVVKYKVVGRRPGDIATCYADPSLARSELGWQAEHDLDRMCDDAWRWQMKRSSEE
jgi:UDP-glucose 4-epimerase